MPDWSYLILHFLHTLALAIWIGGSLALTFFALPALRQGMGEVAVGRLHADMAARFDRVTLGCGLVLIVSSALLIVGYGRLSPWYAIQYVCIGMMCASALFSALVIGPGLRGLRDERPPDDPEIERLDRTSGLARQFELTCALVALFLS